jgi:hypothetical protein
VLALELELALNLPRRWKDTVEADVGHDIVQYPALPVCGWSVDWVHAVGATFVVGGGEIKSCFSLVMKNFGEVLGAR